MEIANTHYFRNFRNFATVIYSGIQCSQKGARP